MNEALIAAAKKYRKLIEKAVQSLDDKDASEAPKPERLPKVSADGGTASCMNQRWKAMYTHLSNMQITGRR